MIHEKEVILNCKFCKNDFIIVWKYRKQQFCSTVCQCNYRKSSAREITECLTCKMPFERYKKIDKRTGVPQQYCSNLCNLSSVEKKEKLKIWGNSDRNHWNDPQVQDKVRKTKLERYGDSKYNNIEQRKLTLPHHTAESIKKMRLSAIRRIEKNAGQVMPNYNPKACLLIEEYGKEHGYNFQHAENGGEFYIKELGYWVDGYDKEKNVVIEVDEKHHRRLKHKERDLHRQQEIENLLNCSFIRLTI